MVQSGKGLVLDKKIVLVHGIGLRRLETEGRSMSRSLMSRDIVPRMAAM